MVELKSCPFCGGKAELHRPSVAVYAICSKCGISTSYIYPPEKAVCRWNNRSAEDALQERIAKLEAERNRPRPASVHAAPPGAGCLTPSEALLWKECEEAMKGAEK